MAVEQAGVLQSFREDLITSGIVIQVEDLWKTYEMGERARCTPSAA